MFFMKITSYTDANRETVLIKSNSCSFAEESSDLFQDTRLDFYCLLLIYQLLQNAENEPNDF
jgi:hypothetical protein